MQKIKHFLLSLALWSGMFSLTILGTTKLKNLNALHFIYFYFKDFT